MITKIKLNNFVVFKNAEITLDKINVISGINMDDAEQSSNGSGKSTLAKNAIVFALYGEVPGLTLKDLVQLGEKEASVEIEIVKGKDKFRIIRKIPSELTVYINDKEVVNNTLTLKQGFINEYFGTYDYFKKYRMIDVHGINLLDLGIVSLRKELMNFVDDVFTGVRKSLLAKKLERETYNVDKRYYTFSLSEKRLAILNAGLDSIKVDYEKFQKDQEIQRGIVNQIVSDIQSKEKIIYYKEQELKKACEGICPILKSKCDKIGSKITDEDKSKMSSEIEQLYYEIEQLRTELVNESEPLHYYTAILKETENKESHARSRLMQLKEAFKFANYKYTAKDVLLYTEAIKTLDEFSGHYINEWLGQLALIINDLLTSLDLKVEFNPQKEFIKITNGTNELKFEQLSSGQKTFLSAIFKLALLIHRGENEGVILADEGLGNLDGINLKKFVDICSGLGMQFIIIYQNLPEINNVKKIEVVRQNGRSTVK